MMYVLHAGKKEKKKKGQQVHKAIAFICRVWTSHSFISMTPAHCVKGLWADLPPFSILSSDPYNLNT